MHRAPSGVQTPFDSFAAGWATKVAEEDLSGEIILARRSTAVALFASCLALYFVHLAPRTQVDCIPAPYTAWSLVRNASFDLSGYPELERFVPGTILELGDGRRISRVPPGSAIAAVPLVAPFALASELPLSSGKMRRLGKWVAALHVAAAVVLFYSLCLGLAPAGARAATLVFAFGTCVFSVASQGLWSHGPALFWLTLSLYLLVVRGERAGSARFALIGFALAMAVVARPATALYGLSTLAALGWRGRWQAILCIGLGAALPAAGLVAYNAHYFAQPFSGGYVDLAAMWTTPFSVGLAGLLIAPSRGVLIYTPALLLIPWGLRALVAREAGGGSFERTMFLFWLGGVAASLLLFARSDWWSGEWSYGPRYLIESMPVLCGLFALAVASPRFQSDRGKWVVRVLATVSVAIHVLGVFSNDAGAWHRRHPESLQLFELRDTQIGSAARHLLGLRPAPNPRS